MIFLKNLRDGSWWSHQSTLPIGHASAVLCHPNLAARICLKSVIETKKQTLKNVDHICTIISLLKRKRGNFI